MARGIQRTGKADVKRSPEGQEDPLIKAALGISGVLTQVYCWHHVADDVYPAGSRINMLIERADHVINVCEMKFSSRSFSIEKSYLTQLKTKLGAFKQMSRTRSSIHLTLVTPVGLLRNKHSGIVQSEVTLDDLFRPQYSPSHLLTSPYPRLSRWEVAPRVTSPSPMTERRWRSRGIAAPVRMNRTRAGMIRRRIPMARACRKFLARSRYL